VRVLLDEQLPFDLAPLLIGHQVRTVRDQGWAGVTNGELLRRAGLEFQAFVTMDRNLEFQQNIAALPLGVLLVRARSNRMLHLRPLVSTIVAELQLIEPGKLRRVGA